MIDSIAVSDVGTHVAESPDLWTSRLPRKFLDAGTVARIYKLDV
jgi:hypothetical protein